MKPRHIAAVEIGSSRIKGIVASVDDTMAIRVLAIEEIDSGESVRYGRVQNARDVGERVSELMRRLENNPEVMPGRISDVFIANGGRSMSSAVASSTVDLGGEAEITNQVVDKLRNEARYNLATDRDVLAIAPRRYMVNNRELKNIVGAYGHMVKGDFTIITASPENRKALNHVDIRVGDRGVEREYITRLLAQTEMALTDSDRQLGCLFVDFGAETTTLAIFKNEALQAACSLPMGSANITRDLSSGLSVTAETAENIKLSKGKAVVERVNIQAPDDETREIINYVSARTGEIVANINAFIEKSGFKASDLSAGIIITGGGSLMKGFDDMLESQTRLKVRRAAVDSSIIMATAGRAGNHFDVVCLVKYAASHSDADCLEFPEEAAPEPTEPERQLAVRQPAQPQRQPDTYAKRRPQARKAAPDINDPHLLDDDEDTIEQPVNINQDGDFNLDDTVPDPDANVARKNLIKRLFDWIAPKTDDIDAED